jgi:hypothetical protein
MILPRNTTDPSTCAPENPSCPSASALSTHTGITRTHLLTRNLIGVLIIAALLGLGLCLWLSFGKWSKPIRQLLRGKLHSERNSNANNDTTVRIGIGNGLAADGATAASESKKTPLRSLKLARDTDDVEKDTTTVMVASCSSDQSLLDRDVAEVDKGDENGTMMEKGVKVDLVPPAKVRHFAGS